MFNPCSKESQLHGYTSGPKKKKPVPKVSSKKKATLKEYKKVRDKYLQDHPKCQVDGCNRFSQDVHHKKGREGYLLTDAEYFLAVCRGCHQKIEINPTWAKENGYSENRLSVDDREVYG